MGKWVVLWIRYLAYETKKDGATNITCNFNAARFPNASEDRHLGSARNKNYIRMEAVKIQGYSYKRTSICVYDCV